MQIDTLSILHNKCENKCLNLFWGEAVARKNVKSLLKRVLKENL